MITRRLAGLLAVIAIIVYFSSWLLHQAYSSNVLTTKSQEKAWEVAVYLGCAFLLLGCFLSKLGIELVQEIISDRNSLDIERKIKAKARYDNILGINIEKNYNLEIKKDLEKLEKHKN